MNLRQIMGLDPEQHFYMGFTANAVATGIKPDGEVFVSLCDDPSKTISMVDLIRLPALPSKLVYRHLDGIEFLDVIEGYQLQDGVLTLNFRPAMAKLVRARGCKVALGHPDLPVQALEDHLKMLFEAR